MSTKHGDRVAAALDDLKVDRSPAQPEGSTRPLAQRMRHLATPGAAIAVIEDHEVIAAVGHGVLRQGESEPVTDATLFQAASLSKPVFALAVMRLAHEGRLDLDADVNGYLTSWRVPANGPWQPRVTLRQLLSHSAGTTVNGFPGYPVSGPWPTLPQILDGAAPANTPPVIVDLVPGLQTRYSGGGTTIAELAVIERTGRALPALMRELIFDPLAMPHSTFEQPLPTALARAAAVGHPWNGVPVRGGWHVYPEMAAAGLWTTAAELARLGAELLRILRGDKSALGLDQAAMREMLRPQVPGQEIGSDFRGLGWTCRGRDAAFQFLHRGSNEGYVSGITLMPARGQGAIVLLNSNQGAALIDEITEAIGRHFAWPQPMPPTPGGRIEGDIDFVGTYRDAGGRAFRVTQAAGHLLLKFDAQPSLKLTPIARLEFAADALELRAHFEIAGNGTVSTLTIIHGGQVVVAARQADSPRAKQI